MSDSVAEHYMGKVEGLEERIAELEASYTDEYKESYNRLERIIYLEKENASLKAERDRLRDALVRITEYWGGVPHSAFGIECKYIAQQALKGE